ncbi:MAG: patatin-like phospholipase family protein [Bacteroidales bacterium]|nr:patatin-like phospholipase family protein [Bacteroidales bacterium]
MRNACRAALAAIALLLAVPAPAQEYENGLSIDSIDPAGDAAAIARMRARMDSIHRTQHRPTIGLVLSGGGAKGSAHAGVIRYLEELEIPVDMICGTSMGGLVGGIAALGYDAHFMDSLLRVQDWNIMLSDQIAPSYYSYARKIYRETYQFAVPLFYAKRDFQSRIDEQFRYYDDGARLNIGQNNLANSLPSGYVAGFNVNNLFSSVAVGYEDRMNFDELPVPYFCVAADMVTLKSKNWSYGSVKDAMRSTMSIPGLFKPVRTDGMILVDGGVRNNFPVDIARAMGVDIVIGVDLTDADPSYSQVNNLLDIIMQFATMLGRNVYSRNVGGTDVFIKPQLDGYNMLSFTPAAIDTMIHRGYIAAKAKDAELREVKSLVGAAKHTLQAPRATDIGTRPVRIYSIEFRGLSNAESRILQRKINIKAGSFVDKEIMQHLTSIIQATGCFSSVTYSILGKEEPYRLVFDCVKGPRHRFGASVRFDTEEWASFLFNVGLNAYKLSGFKLDLDAKVGRNQFASARGALDLSWLPTINLDARIDNVSSSLYTQIHGAGSEARWWGHRERLYLSNIKWTMVDFNIGAQYRYYRLSPRSSYGYETSIRYPDLINGSYVGAFVKGTVYTQDRLYYPSHGARITFGYDYDFLKPGVEYSTPLHTAYFNMNFVMPLGERFAIVPDMHLRALMGSPTSPSLLGGADPTYSLAHQNYVGGVIGGRYIEGQMPFIGLGNVYQAGPYAAVMNVGARLRVGERLYFTATGGYFREAETPREFISSPLPTLWGAGFEVAYNTKAGPVRVLGTWSDRMRDFSQDAGLYISFGFDF